MPAHPIKRLWTNRYADDPLPPEIASFADQLQISPLVAGLLWRRGLESAEDMDAYLSPMLRHLAPPEAYPGVAEAADVLARELAQGRKLAVWGDYDVDGVTSSALVVDFLEKRGIDAAHHIPSRMEEGYGLNIPALERLAGEGVQVLLTVDCGITSTAEIARAKELGMTVVVSDHHLPGPELPPADAVCNPRLGDCPCPHLAGVGVAFLLMAALNTRLPGERIDMRQFLDLAALGTLADVVPLTGQNRIIVKNGLLVLKQARRPGIFALKEASGFGPTAELTAGQVVFSLAPRINAVGRLGQAETAFRLLTAKDRSAARPLAQACDDANRDRQATEEEIANAAMAQAEALPDAAGLVLYEPDWHQGVIGIVASRVVERFYRPTLILTRDDGLLKGSGRSIEEFDLYAGLESMADVLAGFGGHRQAAGLKVVEANLETLRARFDGCVREALGGKPPRPRLKLDERLTLKDLDFRLLKELDMLQPFGMGNPEPVFRAGPLYVVDRKQFGKKREHVALTLHEESSKLTLRAKAWRQAETIRPDIMHERIEVAFAPKIDTYGQIPSIELTIKDWRLVVD
jgi:single-stranded-DNA-specific exonuclease